MKADIKKIYEAHVAFELEQFGKKHLKANMKEEITAAWKWLDTVKLNDVASVENVIAFEERNIKDRKLTKHQKEYIIDLSESIHQLALKSKHTVSDFLNEESFNDIADKLIEQKEIRNKLIKDIVNNPFYGEMIADTLYDGIKSFAAQSGPSNETVGGSLFNLGKGILGAALSGVSDTIDKNIKKFISENLQKSIAKSEQTLKDKLSDAQLRKMAKNIWEKLEDTKVKDLAKGVKLTDKDRTAILHSAEKAIHAALQSDPVAELNEHVLTHFFEHSGNKSIAQILEDNGITEKIVIRESEEFLIPYIEKAAKDGFLKDRIEARLHKFYETL
ncbi:MAG: hypothetical protein KA322_00170 [Chitinophagales bacterium]|jgi:hypothetical protein|nr:hypothetical protein [Chitinophagales bacterium]